MNELTSTWVDIVPQLSAHDSGIIVIPTTATQCSPHSMYADLHPASTLQRAINQTKCSISAILDSCEEETFSVTLMKNYIKLCFHVVTGISQPIKNKIGIPLGLPHLKHTEVKRDGKEYS